jgi:hypothetical protein
VLVREIAMIGALCMRVRWRVHDRILLCENDIFAEE